MINIEKEDIFVPVYKIINGRWTMGGKHFKELSIHERKALGEHVAYLYKTD